MTPEHAFPVFEEILQVLEQQGQLKIFRSVADTWLIAQRSHRILQFEPDPLFGLFKVLAGRSRWKVENENNNTLKTKGHNLEHNFGHGKQHLSSFLATLNILSLLFHTLLELLDLKYKLLRSHLPTRKTFFDDLRTLTRHMYKDLRAIAADNNDASPRFQQRITSC